jgi:hypothetical protein
MVTGRGGGPALSSAAGCGAARTPPSAAGPLEPYGVRVMLRPASGEFEPQGFLTGFLQEIAAGCLASGATVIGHLKSLLPAPACEVACNLTSLREGVRCSVRPGDGGVSKRVTLQPGQEARLDLAVLVYGLPAATIDELVRSALPRFLDPLHVRWSAGAE